jgi:hypothetical protein
MDHRMFWRHCGMADLRRADGLSGSVRSQSMFGNAYGNRLSNTESPTFNRSYLQNSSQSQSPNQRPNSTDRGVSPQDANSSRISRIQKKLQRAKAMNHKLSDVVPESKLILQLVEMERRIAAECERTRCEMEDLNSTPEPSSQTVRVTIFNTHRSIQTDRMNVGTDLTELEQPGHHQSGLDANSQSGPTEQSWTLHISCSLVNPEFDSRRGSDASKPSDFGLDKYFDKVISVPKNQINKKLLL